MTKPWRVLRFNQPKFTKSVAALTRFAAPDSTRVSTVAEIIAAVRHEGDAALVRFARKYDKLDLTPATLLVPPRKFEPPAEVVDALFPSCGSPATGPAPTARAQRWARSSIRWSASAFTSPVAQRRWFPPHS
jgi:Histidinol dehydrogenase